MLLTYRSAEVKDLPSCYALLPEGFFCSRDLRERLPYLWREALQRGEMTIDIVEDGCKAPGDPERIQAFTASAFIDEAAAGAMRSPASEPYPSATTACRWLRGSSPFLSPAEIRKGNSGSGLTLFVVHQGFAGTPNEYRKQAQVRIKATESLISSYNGYNLRSLLQEVYGWDSVQRSIAFGARMMNDYASHFAARTEIMPQPSVKPYLIGVTRDNVVRGSHAETLFYHSQPRIYFTSAEQDVLKLALNDCTDEEIAETLCVSASAVHKRWTGLYERVRDRASDLLVGKEEAPGQQQRRRGSEKRRILLSYLRHHPEELRPIDQPSG